MSSFESTITIDASAEKIWPVLSDVSKWPQWLPTVSAVEPLGAPPLAIGARYRIVQPKLRPAVWSVVELSPMLGHFSWESRSPGVRVLASHSLRSVSAGKTSVSLRIDFAGPMAWMAGLLAGRLTREYLEREAVALKRRVETFPSAAGDRTIVQQRPNSDDDDSRGVR